MSDYLCLVYFDQYSISSGPGSVIGIATGYGLGCPGIESRLGRDFPHISRPVLGPTQPPVQMGTGSFPGVKSGRGVTLATHPLLVPWSRKSRAIPLLPLWTVRPVQSLSACTRVHFTLLCRNSGAERSTGAPMLDALQSVSRLILCVTFPAALLPTVRSCHGVKKKRSVHAFDHSRLFRAEFQVANIYVYSFPHVFVLLCLTERRGWTFSVRTGIFYYAEILLFLYRIQYEIGG